MDTDKEKSFTHETFRIAQEDENNVNLYRTEQVEIKEGGGRGLGPGTPTGRYEPKEVFKGHFTTFTGAFRKMIDIMASESKNVEELKSILEMMIRFKPDQTLFS